MTVPSPHLIDAARMAALNSPCAKSKRGVVIYDEENRIVGQGCNAPPGVYPCSGSADCRKACSKLCTHAELAAIFHMLIDAPRDPYRLTMLHVKVSVGVVIPSGGPSCWQCSREILRLGLRGVWLFENSPHDFDQNRHCPTMRVEFDRCMYCQNEACGTHDYEACDCAVDERHQGVPDAPSATWRFYNAEEFHQQTLAECRLPNTIKQGLRK